MKKSNEELQNLIEAIDVVMNFTISNEEDYVNSFVKDSEIYIVQSKLLEMRNEVEKQIFMNNNS